MIKSKHNVIIFHGHDGDPSGNWFPWMKSELENLGVETFVPELPKGADQTPEKFIDFFENFKDKINENTILMGHSLGGPMILKILPLLEKPVFGSVFVGSFGKVFNDSQEEAVLQCNAFVKDVPWKKVRKKAGHIKIIASTNDPYIPVDISVNFGAMLQQPIEFFDGAGHFMASNGFEKFPKLLEYLKTQIFLTYDEFTKLDARIGHILKVEPVEDADKLLRFEIDFGEGESRQIVSGIREFFPDYETLVGKKALYVLNLEPREIKGITSYGMLMAVDDLESKPTFLIPEDDVNPGSSVR